MADDTAGTRPFCKGSVHHVTIEDVLPDLLIVCLKHGTNVYRGILLDSVKRELPCGVNFSMNALKKSYEPSVKESSAQCGGSESAVTPSSTPEMSGLVNRLSYTLDYQSGRAKLLTEPRRYLPRPLRDKNIRNMRLRPRQVLCWKCKQGIHDTPIMGNPGAKSSQTQTAQIPEPAPKPQERYETRKRKQLLAAATSEAPHKSKKLDGTNKSSPIIKISFAGPKGQGTIVEIPSKPNIPSDSEEGKNTPSQVSIDDEDSSQMVRDNYRKFRKAQKKAGKRIRSRTIDSDLDSVSSENHTSGMGIKHKKSKRTKHKVKRRHKHKAGRRHNSGQSEGNESFKENTVDSDRSRTAIVVDEGAASSVVDNMVMYAADDSDTNSLSRFQEHSDLDDDDVDNQDGIIVLSPRHNFMFDCDNMKMGTPNKQYDSNTETSQELDLDFTNMPEDFFGSNKTSPNGSDTENNLSDAPFDVHQVNQENMDTDFGGEYTNGDSHGPRGFGPLTMRIQNRHVGKVILDDDRIIRNGDVIWGKIHGFPWWPGRVMSITESLKDSGVIINQTAQISWFASSTMSHMSCSELYPFLQDFKLRYNKKKKGSYKVAVKQARMIAQSIAAELHNRTPDLTETVEVDILDP